MNMNDIEALQKEKLRLEVKDLAKPFFMVPSFWISCIGVIVAIGGVFAQSYLSKIEMAKAELLKEETKKEVLAMQSRKDSTEKVVTDLEAEVESLEIAKHNLSMQSRRLIDVVSTVHKNTSNKNVEIAVKSVENSFFSIALYGFNVNQGVFDLAASDLKKNGYSLTKALILTSRPPWLSLRSTVLYYDDSAEAAAKTLAEELSLKTGKQFVCSKGAGLGIPKDQEAKTFRIHFVG
jgi:hypothetical protein